MAATSPPPSRLDGAPDPDEAGSEQSAPLPAGGKRYVALRAAGRAGQPGSHRFSGPRRAGSGRARWRPRLPTGLPGSAPSARPCLPRRLGVSSRGIGPARLGTSLGALRGRYRVLKRGGRATRMCVRGGGRFLVGSRAGRIDIVMSTARGHRTRGAAAGRRLARGRPAGARPAARGLYVARRGRPGRVVYGVRRARVRFLGAGSRRAVARPRALARRLRAIGLR